MEAVMRGKHHRKIFLNVLVAASSFCLSSAAVQAQEGQRFALSSPSKADPEIAAEVGALSELIHDLQAQVQELNSQLGDLRAEQRQTSEDARALRHELELAKAGIAPAATFVANVPASQYSAPNTMPSGAQTAPASTLAAPRSAAEADRIATLEENQETLNDRINEQSQTKVESGSKYRLRLSGMVLLNLYDNRGSVDNQDFPQIAAPARIEPFHVSSSAFGGTLRQSQIKLQTFGPDIAGARTSADLEFDFAGGFANTWNGAVMGLVRLRTGTIRLDWANTSIIAGQDRLFFAPLAPTSLATLATPALSYAGNLWGWTPQVRVEHHFRLSDVSNVVLQAGILDSLSGDMPESGIYRTPSWGEQSGQPAYATRISWNHRAFGHNFTVGAGGYYGRQDWGLNRTVDGWAGTADVTLPLGKLFEFTGAFYRGRAVAGLAGGIGQSVLLNGSFIAPATTFRALDSMGGWAQLKIKLKANFEINAALGLDNPFAGELRQYTSHTIYPNVYVRNLSPLINFIYQIRSDILFSTEYRHLQTSVLDGGSNSANHVNLSLGYIF
jgi:hypothetical protein